LYRLGDPSELEYIGVRDYFGPDSVCLVEWPERGAGMLPQADLEIEITAAGVGRHLVCRGLTEVGSEVVTNLCS